MQDAPPEVRDAYMEKNRDMQRRLGRPKEALQQFSKQNQKAATQDEIQADDPHGRVGRPKSCAKSSAQSRCQPWGTGTPVDPRELHRRHGPQAQKRSFRKPHYVPTGFIGEEEDRMNLLRSVMIVDAVLASAKSNPDQTKSDPVIQH